MVEATGAGRHIGLVTYDARPHATDDDRFLVDALVARRAGTYAAPIPTSIKTIAAPNNASGSAGLTP